ncbi:MAG: hypothetical protein J6S81_03250, partial [Treponema sp.]|nr:hypothetical protein [Treponema sp.]
MNKCIFKYKQVLGKKVTGERLRLSLRVFLARTSVGFAYAGLSFFLRKKRKTRVFYQRTLLEHASGSAGAGLAFFLRKKRKNSGFSTDARFLGHAPSIAGLSMLPKEPSNITVSRTYFLEVTSVQELQYQEESCPQGIQGMHRHQ